MTESSQLDEDQPSSVGIVILNWNSYDDTAECLESLEEANYPNFEVVVVDNGSIDGSGETLQIDYEWIHVIESKTNNGFAGGCNIGIEWCHEQGADHVLLLNNDTVVEPDFLEPLVETAESREKVAGVTGVIREQGSGEIWSAGGEFNPLLVKSSPVTESNEQGVGETGFVTGALLLLPWESVEKFGGLNDDFFFGGEDKEFSYRAKQADWSLLVNHESVVYHEVSSTSGSGSPFRFYHSTRNRLLFASMHLTILQRVMFYTFFFSSRLLRALQWGIVEPEKRDRVKAIALGFWDYFTGHEFRKPPYFGLP